MSTLRLLLAFSESVKCGSFAKAARELGLSPSAVAKSIARLEQNLNIRLFHRSTRRIGLTQEGEELFERVSVILEQVNALKVRAENTSHAPTGTLRLNILISYGKMVLLPIISKLAKQYPELSFDIRLSDEFTDVIADGLDAVVRGGEIHDSRLIAKTFDVTGFGVYGAPGYFAEKGRPAKPEDIAAHECILYRHPSSRRDRLWRFLEQKKESIVHPASKYRFNDWEAMIVAAINGLGILQLPDFMVKSAVAAGQLEEVLPEYKCHPVPISLVFPSNRQIPLRLRVLIEALDDFKHQSGNNS